MILPPFDSEASNFRQLAPSTFGHQELAVTSILQVHSNSSYLACKEVENTNMHKHMDYLLLQFQQD